MNAIVVYGSLINKLQLDEQARMFAEACPVLVDDYRRVFNQEPSWRRGRKRYRAALNVMQSSDAYFNGVLVRVRDESGFRSLDQRERGYDRITVDPSTLRSFGDRPLAIHYESIHMYVGKPEKRNDDLLPNSDYLDLCLRGARHWGDEFHEQFLQTTYVGRRNLKHRCRW